MGWFSKLFTRKGKPQNRRAIEKLENGIRRGNVKVQTFNPYKNRNKWTENGSNTPLYANSNAYKSRKRRNNMIKKTMNNARVMPWIKPLNSYPKSNALTKRMQKRYNKDNKNLITFPNKNLITFPNKNLITFPNKNLITFPNTTKKNEAIKNIISNAAANHVLNVLKSNKPFMDEKPTKVYNDPFKNIVVAPNAPFEFVSDPFNTVPDFKPVTQNTFKNLANIGFKNLNKKDAAAFMKEFDDLVKEFKTLDRERRDLYNKMEDLIKRYDKYVLDFQSINNEFNSANQSKLNSSFTKRAKSINERGEAIKDEAAAITEKIKVNNKKLILHKKKVSSLQDEFNKD